LTIAEWRLTISRIADWGMMIDGLRIANQQSAISNQQSAIGNRQSAIGNLQSVTRQSSIGNRQ
jgi:hypothetical protein